MLRVAEAVSLLFLFPAVSRIFFGNSHGAGHARQLEQVVASHVERVRVRIYAGVNRYL